MSRATVVSACGSGKTRIAARAAGRLVPDGRVLVMVPTLELVGQLLRSFAEHGGVDLGRVVAVCSSKEAVQAGDLGLDAAVTTDPEQLAGLCGAVTGRLTVACTYQSLPVLAAAHATYGLLAWDLVVVDEAHRTAGRAGRRWSVIHDDVLVPAQRRLYMTATPRIVGAGGDDLVHSMDDVKTYGRVVFRFTTSQGIARGLLADYQTLVVVITDAQIRQLTESDATVRIGGAEVSPRTLATQVAVLKAAAEHGVRRAITFHNRVADARNWAQLLPHARDLLPAEQRPATVDADLVYGDQPAEERRAALKRLRATDATDAPASLRVVCNARVLTEGVDAPAVDAIVLVDPRNSEIDTVQAVGRALRTGGRPGKIARIIVPVILGPEEDPETALEGSAYAAVWKVVRALRAHDDRLADRLDRARVQRAAHGAASTTDPHDRDADPQGQVTAPLADGGVPWLDVCGAGLPEGFSRAIQLRVVTTATSSWMEKYGLARAYRQAHGNLNVTSTYVTPDGVALGAWVRNQRRHRHRLGSDQVRMLDEIGIVWDRIPDERWKHGVAAAQAYADQHGSLHRIPHTWTHTNGIRLRIWLTARRTDLADGRLSKQRTDQLNAIDPTWHNRDAVWEHAYNLAQAYAAEHGHLRPELDPGYRPTESVDLPTWLDRQRQYRRAGSLPPTKREQLDAIGMPWSIPDDNFQRGLAAASGYVAAHGDLNVSHAYKTEDGFPLGSWLLTRRPRARNGRMSPEHRNALDALDPDWAARRNTDTDWDGAYAAARDYVAEHGRLPHRKSDPRPTGVDFRPWLHRLRSEARRGKLGDAVRAALDNLDPNWLDRNEAGRWNAMLQKLTRWMNETGADIIPHSAVIDDAKIGRWFHAQLQKLDRHALTDDQATRLRALSTSGDPHDLERVSTRRGRQSGDPA